MASLFTQAWVEPGATKYRIEAEKYRAEAARLRDELAQTES